jgi:hypothetical protein
VPKPSRILVCGGRDFTDQARINQVLNECRPFFEPEFLLIHGGARGADMGAHVWAFFAGCAVMRMDANWDFYGRQAGAVRNRWMLKWAKPDLVIAFPGGNGTANMIAESRKAGVEVYEVR